MHLEVSTESQFNPPAAVTEIMAESVDSKPDTSVLLERFPKLADRVILIPYIPAIIGVLRFIQTGYNPEAKNSVDTFLMVSIVYALIIGLYRSLGLGTLQSTSNDDVAQSITADLKSDSSNL
jgi:hypothetical protein